MTDYLSQVKTLTSVCGGDEAMRGVILRMVENDLLEAEAEAEIINILWTVFECDNFMPYLNDYRELRMRKAEGCQTPIPENFPDPMNIEQFAQYIGKSLQWCYNNTRILPKTQNKPGGKMGFYKQDVDKWKAKQFNKGAK